MDDVERLKVLEAALAQMLRPIKNVPFSVIVRAMSGHQVVKVDTSLAEDRDLVAKLQDAIHQCRVELTQSPIRRPRPNEVGNDVEAYVMRAVTRVGFTACRPTSKTGLGKATGYPDILLQDYLGRHTYLECKISAQGLPETTMRSFYLSPSDSFKVSRDARHLLLAFGMEANAIQGSQDSRYVPRSYKLVDLYDLLCDVKYEFNSDTRRLYSRSMILSEGNF